ncbi:response regulator transcription factor [Actibacterium sp. 188UL27-1]|uniref:response regulator transcription factor n=1 Tax=Actibacterium sp. 188UL27-1 TaxID=2786961 RepID=UPI001957C4C2|nr:response regulator [Actibacterium sp. 188UL27-1]MBM7068628.1 response regulator [Actibacterium sp. 188UL27-1]
MKVLIVESNENVGGLWQRHLERLGFDVTMARGQTDAIHALRSGETNIIVMDVMLDEGSAFAVSDFASYRYPDTKVIFVTNTTFFSDGSIFQHAPNACAFLQVETPPEDLAAMVEHYGKAG